MKPEEIKKILTQIDVGAYLKEQQRLAQKVIKKDRLPQKIRFVAGTDVAYDTNGENMVGAIVVLDADTLKVVESASHKMKINFPYVPGLFSFREIPPLLKAFEKLNTKPDLIVCDGHGIAHPKKIGMASHLGVVLDIPTIGCAKKRLVGAYDRSQLEKKRGAFLPMIEGGESLGVALRTQDKVKPMFVSIGHKVTLPTAIKWVLHLSKQYRLPETTRQADQLVNKLRKEG